MKRLRKIRMGLSTLFGKPQGFFIPYRYASSVPTGHRIEPYESVKQVFDGRREDMVDMLQNIVSFHTDLNAIGPDTPPEPRWNQSWFPPLDAAALYTLIRTIKPSTIIEIGSGHSSRFTARAIRDGGLSTRFIAIDPEPRAVIEGLPIDFHYQTVDGIDPHLFEQLRGGDILFIDSSHILLPGTDVDFLFNRILPRLPAGVLIHIHDICLPDPYPESWTWRGYNEQQGVVPLVTSGAYDVLFSSWYADRSLADKVSHAVGHFEKKKNAINTSLWIKKV